MTRFSSWGEAMTLPLASTMLDCWDKVAAVNSLGRASNMSTPVRVTAPAAPTLGITRPAPSRPMTTAAPTNAPSRGMMLAMLVVRPARIYPG